MAAPPNPEIVLSTVFLNWNRCDLLRKTLTSYVETVSVPHEAFVIDNGSTDESPALIQEFCQSRCEFHPILLSENRGGEALNEALGQCRGRLMHISENDLEYMPGWDMNLIRKFDAFPDLGQLALFSPFHQAERGEIWEDKAATARANAECTIYITEANVGTASVIRREVWERGVRWTNYESGRFRFPNDGQFSADVRQLGYLVAWNDEYVVINWGHNIEDMVRRLPYYLENYEAKQWFGLRSFRWRLEDHGYALVRREGGYTVVDVSGSPWYTLRRHVRVYARRAKQFSRTLRGSR